MRILLVLLFFCLSLKGISQDTYYRSMQATFIVANTMDYLAVKKTIDQPGIYYQGPSYAKDLVYSRYYLPIRIGSATLTLYFMDRLYDRDPKVAKITFTILNAVISGVASRNVSVVMRFKY